MNTSLKAKLFAQASVDAGLQALLLSSGSPAVFRWFDQSLPQGYAGPGKFPAVAVSVVSNPADYAVTGKLPTSWARVQFTIYGTGADSENAELVADALAAFLEGFNGTGLNGLVARPNQIVGDRDGGIANTQPPTFQRFVDVRIFSNSTI